MSRHLLRAAALSVMALFAGLLTTSPAQADIRTFPRCWRTHHQRPGQSWGVRSLGITARDNDMRLGTYYHFWIDTNSANPGPEYKAEVYPNSDGLILMRVGNFASSGIQVDCRGLPGRRRCLRRQLCEDLRSPQLHRHAVEGSGGGGRVLRREQRQPHRRRRLGTGRGARSTRGSTADVEPATEPVLSPSSRSPQMPRHLFRIAVAGLIAVVAGLSIAPSAQADIRTLPRRGCSYHPVRVSHGPETVGITAYDADFHHDTYYKFWIDTHSGNPGPEYKAEIYPGSDVLYLKRVANFASGGIKFDCEGFQGFVETLHDSYVKVIVPRSCIGTPPSVRVAVVGYYDEKHPSTSWTGRRASSVLPLGQPLTGLSCRRP